MPEREWRRVGGLIPLAEVFTLGEKFVKGHERNPQYGSGLAMEQDFAKFFDHFGGLKQVEKDAVRRYVMGRMRLAKREPTNRPGPPPWANGNGKHEPGAVVQGGRQ